MARYVANITDGTQTVVWDAVIALGRKSDKHEHKLGLADALVNKGRDLATQARWNEARELFAEVVESFGDVAAGPLALAVVRALKNEAACLTAADRYEEALVVYDECRRRIEISSASGLLDEQVEALCAEARCLYDLGRIEDAAGVIQQVYDVADEELSPDAEQVLAETALLSAYIAQKQGHPQGVIDLYDLFEEEFPHEPGSDLHATATMFMVLKANAIGEVRTPREAISACQEIIDNEGSVDPLVRLSVAQAYLVQAFWHAHVGNEHAAVVNYQTVIDTFLPGELPQIDDAIEEARDALH